MILSFKYENQMSVLKYNYQKLIDPSTNQIPDLSELTFTCSKSAIETLEKVVKYVQR